MAYHPSSSIAPSLILNYLSIIALTAMDKKLIDSRDFGQCMPVFQALGGEMKAIIPLLNNGKNTSQNNKEENDDFDDNLKPSKRSRVATTENNSKTRKTGSSLFPAISDVEDRQMSAQVEVVLDTATLTWSTLLGPEGKSSCTISHPF